MNMAMDMNKKPRRLASAPMPTITRIPCGSPAFPPDREKKISEIQRIPQTTVRTIGDELLSVKRRVMNDGTVQVGFRPRADRGSKVTISVPSAKKPGWVAEGCGALVGWPPRTNRLSATETLTWSVL